MATQTNQAFEKMVFGDYEIVKSLPFKIMQAPFRKFSKYQRDGHWNEKERLKYTVFLCYFQRMLEDPELKKNARIYEMMSDMIITRNPSQCRSHHQKMEKYRSTIKDIISSVTEKYEPSVYEDIKEKYSVFIKTLLQNSDKYIRLPTSTEKRKEKSKRYNLLKPNTKISIKNQRGEIIAEAQLNEDPKSKKQNKRTRDNYSDEEDQEKPESKMDGKAVEMKDEKNQQQKCNALSRESAFSRMKQEDLHPQIQRDLSFGSLFKNEEQNEKLSYEQEIKKERNDSLVIRNQDLAQYCQPAEKPQQKTGSTSFEENKDGDRLVSETLLTTPFINHPLALPSMNFMPMSEPMPGATGMIPMYMPFQEATMFNAAQQMIIQMQEKILQLERENSSYFLAFNRGTQMIQVLKNQLAILQYCYDHQN